jgi:hypothetical protein
MILLLLIGASTADEPNVVYKERTEIDFEDVEVEGQLKKPVGDMILESQRARFNPLVVLRENFEYEMQLSVKQIK